MPELSPLDRLISAADNSLRTLFASASTGRPVPGADVPAPVLADKDRERVGRLMRVNHTGEVCAQALYQGQALTCRTPELRASLDDAAREETEHLAWTERRIAELGGRRSLLNPLWYAGSFTIGALAGAAGDRWNLGFLAETERQVERHLDGHLKRLPREDSRSAAILSQMKVDEAAHATHAVARGAADLPLPVRLGMQAVARVMTGTSYWV